MLILAILVSVALFDLAVLHMLWGFGFWFPIRDEPKLVAAVIGARGVDRMPGPIPCGVVSALLLIVLIVLWGAASWLQAAIIYGAAAVFILRGGMSYLPLWRKMTPQEPFATYDRRIYGPLCLGLGVGLGLIQCVGF